MSIDKMYDPWIEFRDSGKTDDNCCCPSEMISNHLGFDFYKDYELNYERDFYTKLIQAKYKDNDFEFFEDEVNYLVDKYPKLSSIKLSNILDYYGLIFGCISKFNEDDIDFFINNWGDIPTNDKEPHRWNMSIFECELKIHFGYIPSPSTLELLNDHFNLKLYD